MVKPRIYLKTCLQTAHLYHRYAPGREVLTDLNLAVPEGSIYGFVGPNGAGKTTTLRLLLGLLRRQQGAISLFGRDLDSDRIEILRKIGSLIEGPSLYEHLTATENLRVTQMIYRSPRQRLAEVLELVGLSAAREKLVSEFSLGMKQRLAIGVAILHRPALLILDEPTNGLDPNGIVDMRRLLKQLNQEHGTTILVSSHLLSEVERLATHLGIVHHGRLLFQGTLDELRRRRSERTQAWVSTSDDEAALKLIRQLQPLREAVRIDDGRIRLASWTRGELAVLNRRLVNEGFDVYELGSQAGSLETIFMEMVAPDAIAGDVRSLSAK